MLFLLLLIFCSFSCSGLFGFLFVNDAVVEVVVMANDSRDECLLLGVAFKVIVSFAIVCGKREKIIYQSTTNIQCVYCK